MTNLTGLAVWGLAALAVVLPVGYLVPLSLLALAQLGRPWRHIGLCQRRDELLPGFASLLFGVVWVAMGSWHGEWAEAWRLTWPAWLVLPASVVLMAWTPSPRWLWSGLAMGGGAAGVWALIHQLMLDGHRADVYGLNAILFGNLSLLIGLFCLATLGWARRDTSRWSWNRLLLCGALGGGVASMLSGTRGGWVVLPFLLVLLGWTHRSMTRNQRLLALVTVLASVWVTYLIPQTGLQERVELTREHVVRYLSGERDVTTGARMEIWQAAVFLIEERPLAGWGQSGYHLGMHDLGEEGRVDPRVERYWHAHNDLLDAWSKRGLPGLFGLLLLYATPLWLFRRGLFASSPSCRALASCGILLPLAFMGFGLSYSFMAYPVGIALYTAWMSVLWVLYKREVMDSRPETVPTALGVGSAHAE